MRENQLVMREIRRVTVLSLERVTIISRDGVTINVKTVEKARPKTIALDSEIHHCVEGAPKVVS